MARLKKQSILLVDAAVLLRAGLRCLLDATAEFEVLAEAADGREAVKLAKKHAPTLIIIEAVLPQLNGPDTIRRLDRLTPRSRILVLSDRTEPELITEALKAGADGYLSKSTGPQEVLRALRNLVHGKTHLGPDAAGIVVDRHLRRPRRARPTGQLPELTAREREVLQLMAEGQTTRRIAEILFISPKTVGSHRQNIMKKLGLRTVADLTREAIRAGLVSLKD